MFKLSPVFDVTIIRNFYETVPMFKAEDPEATLAEAHCQIETLWGNYIDALPEKQKLKALELKYLIISQPAILPEKFTYLDILKAILLIAIPDIRLSNHLQMGLLGKRNDEWFSGIKYAPLENKHHQLTQENSSSDLKDCIDSFVKWVINNELDLETKSPFYKFLDYLNNQTKYSKFTVTQFSLMLANEITEFIQIILNDSHIMTALVSTDIPPSQWISILHKMFAYYLSAYVLIGLEKTQIKREDYEEQKKMEDALKYTQMIYHVDVSGLMVNGFNANANVIVQYNTHVKRNINLGVSPAITEEEKTLQAVLYPLIVQALTAYLAILNAQDTEDTAEHRWKLEHTMSSLGLTSDQNPTLFICAPYSFPKSAFNFPKISEATFEEDILTYFFLLNIDYIKQISRDQFGYEFYMISIERLWTAFMNDSRCPNNIKDYAIIINTHTLLPSILDTINKVANQANIDAATSNVFADILFTSVKSKNSKLLMALAHSSHSQPINKENDTTILADHVSEGHLTVYLKAYISEARQYVSENVLIDAMSILLDSGLLLHNKLQFIGAIAAGRNADPEQLSKKTDPFYKKISILCAIKEAKDIAIILRDQFINERVWRRLSELAKSTSIPTLIALYDNFSNSQMTLKINAYHIETQCSREQLTRLSEWLEHFTTLNAAPLGLHMRYSSSLQKIITQIANEKPAAEILCSLKKMASKKASNKNSVREKLYSAINQFFSEDKTDKNKKMENLLACIEEASTTTSRPSPSLSGEKFC